MRFVIVTGMSGAGKSTALKMLEDVGYFCVDNLPIALVTKFAELAFGQASDISRVALGVDIRSGEALGELEKVLERTGKQRDVIEIGDVAVYLSEHMVTKGGVQVSLKPLEYDLLVMLAKNKNVAFSRDQLLNQVWGSDYLGETRTIDVHIGQLRKKLGLSNVIKTIPKIGYRLED